jgi:mitogen-activated protein kinase kinase 7
LDYVALSTIAMFFFQKYKTEIKDLEHQGELGNGTCGHVVKMRHKPSETVIAVKVTDILCLN